MTELVDPDKIENIVGVPRHARAHYARAVSKTKTVYILHSKQCLEEHEDLRNCPFSLALDKGINLRVWTQDAAVPVRVYEGWLEPIRVGV